MNYLCSSLYIQLFLLSLVVPTVTGRYYRDYICSKSFSVRMVIIASRFTDMSRVFPVKT